MNAMVIYESNTGFTQQYAQWIAQALGCSSQPLKAVSAKELSSVDTVIFGGWIMGNNIMGLDKMKKLAAPAVIFAVGASEQGEKTEAAIREQNQLGDADFYYFQGGFRFNQLGFVQRGMLKMLKKAAAKKENPTQADRYMAEVLGTSFDCSDHSQIQPLVDAAMGR